MAEEKEADDLFVLFRFEGAGGIHQDSAGGRQGGSLTKEFQLGRLVTEKVRLRPVPADVRVPAGDTGAGAGGVDQDAVKGTVIGGNEILEGALPGRTAGAGIQAPQVFAQLAVTVRVRFDGGDPQPEVPLLFDESTGLPPRPAQASR